MGDPIPGQVWKYGWMFVTIVRSGPKTITYRSNSEGSKNTRVSKDRFLSRFHLTGL